MSKSLRYILIFVFILIISSTISIFTFAEETLDLGKALEHGIDNNSELLDRKTEIESIKRELQRNKAGQDWQIGVSGDYLVEGENSGTDTRGGNNNQIGEIGESEDSINVNINKQFEHGFNINPQIEIIPEDMSSEYSISAEQSILPLIPAEPNRNYIRTEAELKEAERTLKKNKAEQIVSWIETYYSLIELKKSLDLTEKRLKLAENELKEIKERQEVEEAGEQELISARLEVKEVETEMRQTENNFEETEKNFYSSLGLKEDQKVKIKDESSFLKLIAAMASESNLPEKEISKLMEEVKKIDNELVTNREQRKLMEKEKKWEQKRDGLELTLNGGYDSMSEDASVSFSLSYDLYDSGLGQLDREEIEEDISTNKRNYEEIYKQKQIELEELLKQIDLSQEELSTVELRLEQATLEKNIAENQKNEGSITQNEYEDMEIAKKEAEINVKSGEDQILLDKLDLISFVNPEKIITIMEAGE